MPADIDSLLKKAVNMKASDLHIRAGVYPVVRVNGVLTALAGEERLSPEDTSAIAQKVMDEIHKEQFSKELDIDVSYSVPGLGRFRCNCFIQRGTVAIVFRVIPLKILALEDLYLPDILKKVALEPRGMILVTGTTGSGKTTTLSSMIDYINANKSDNVITIEDPVEFLHRDKKSIISQREIGNDAVSFAKALRAALRQDPDVILVGEMRDFETIKTALDAAETGHLVLSTLHTIDAVETINRIISVFPPYQQSQVRAQLASVLKAIISMRLVERADQKGVVPAVEVLIATATIKGCIEDPEKTKNINDHIADGVSQYGMQTFDQSLLGLYKSDLITYESAVSIATNPDDFALKVKGIQSTSDAWSSGGISDDSEGEAVRRLKGSLAEVRGYALKLLNYRSRSRKEMRERLGKKGFAPEHINDVMEFLERAKLINDELLASDLFRLSTERKYLGCMGVRMFLTSRGIPKELIDKTMSVHTMEMEELSARNFIGKKLNSLNRHPDNVVKRRLWGMLQRRGYSISVISKMMREVEM